MRTSVSILLIALLAACTAKQDSSQPQATAASSTPTAADTGSPISSNETAVAPEVNPPGDIPDSQAFVNYENTSGGYQLETPEGWARTEAGSGVKFVSKFNGVSVAVARAGVAPTVASARANEAKQIQTKGRAVSITGISEANLPGGKAIVIKYLSNSEPNPVTNRQIRLENVAYLFHENGKEATLTVWAPKGADNVDQWNRMSRSFHWL